MPTVMDDDVERSRTANVSWEDCRSMMRERIPLSGGMGGVEWVLFEQEVAGGSTTPCNAYHDKAFAASRGLGLSKPAEMVQGWRKQDLLPASLSPLSSSLRIRNGRGIQAGR
jgi:hypothetical protein